MAPLLHLESLKKFVQGAFDKLVERAAERDEESLEVAAEDKGAPQMLLQRAPICEWFHARAYGPCTGRVTIAQMGSKR